MRLGILGPLLVADDGGRQVAIGAARQRALLAALLVRTNRVVPVGELAEIVWDGAPPRGAARTVRSYVMRLRHVVGIGVAARIVTREPGYLCQVSDNELDVLCFEGLCRDTSAALHSGQWAEASVSAERALRLWRGTPLLDVPSQALHDEFVPRIEQLRLQALEDRIEADLNLGRHDRLVPELQDLTSRHPLRERFHVQLMVALVGAGRPAEAVAAYQDVRHVLIEELGVEPGPELRRLQERILARNGQLAAPSPTDQAAQPARTHALVPRQLPAGVRHFTGRQAELDLLTGLRGETELSFGAGGTVVISAIDGMAGIGKTALAVHAAHQLAEYFPDGQLFIDLHGYTRGYPPRSAGEALEVFLRTLGVTTQHVPRDLEERAALYRQRLADTQTLVLLDNAIDEAQVRPLLPGAAGCLVLITSRRRLKGLDDAHPVALDVLPEADALALLRTVAGQQRVPAGDPLWAEIAELCGRLPLALRIAAALLRHRPAWTLKHLAGLLHDHQQRITALRDGERDLGAVFDLSYNSLPDTHQHLFRCFGLIPGPDVDAYATAALIDSDPATATQLLEDLVDHNLLIQHTLGRYRMHDLIRAHAHALANPEPAAALDRLLDYYQHTAGRADALLAPYARPAPRGPVPTHPPALPDMDSAWAWLRTERPNLLAALHHSTGPRRVIALTAALANLHRTDGPWTQAITLHSAAITAAEHLRDRQARATALTDLGEARYLVGDFRGATDDLRAALDIFRDAGDRRAHAAALARLGEVWALTGDLPGAIRDLEQALDIFRDTGDRRAQATALDRLGDVRMLTGDLAGATHDLRAALDIFRNTGDRRAQATALARLGAVRAKTGDPSGAIQDLHQGLELLREVGDRRGQARVLTHLGSVQRLTGDLPSATHDLRAALDILQELGDSNGQAGVLTYLGAVHRIAGDLTSATRDLEKALDIFRTSGARGNEAFALNHYAAVVADTGDTTQAALLYCEALHLARQTQQPDEQAHALEGIGECHHRAGDDQTATTHLQQALDIFQRLTMTPDASRIRTRLRKLANRSH